MQPRKNNRCVIPGPGLCWLASLIILSFLVMVTGSALAEVKTYDKEYTYQASELDSKASSRTVALQQVKRLLLEELGTYLESISEAKESQLTKDQIVILTAGIVKTNIVDEKWDGKAYWIKVKMAADPDEVFKSIQRTRENYRLSNELRTAKSKTDYALKEIERLKKERKSSKSTNAKIALKQKYEEQVKTLRSVDEWAGDLSELTKSIIAVDKKDYAYAILINKKIILKNPTYHNADWIIVGAYMGLVDAYYKMGMYEEAISSLKRAEQADTKSAFSSIIYKGLGMSYISLFRNQEAIDQFKKSLSILYLDKEKLEKMSKSEYDNMFGPGEYQSNKDRIDVSIAENYGGIILAELGIATKGSKNPNDPNEMILVSKEALSARKKILEIKPNDINLLRRMSRYQFADDSSELINWCDKLIKVKPNVGEVYYIRGINGSRLKNHKQAIDDISKAINLDPNIPNYYETRAPLYVLLGIYNKAKEDYNRAIDLNPTSAVAYLGRGMAGMLMNETDPKNTEDLKTAARLGDQRAAELLREMRVKW
jgi:tetratricopeptide (TPR) repeat protein